MNGHSHPESKKDSESIILRRASLWEGYAIGKIAAKIYYDSALNKLVTPGRAKYYSDYERGTTFRQQTRMLDPRNITIIACEKSSPEKPIGYAQFIRLGDDEGAKKQIKSRQSLHLWLLSWLFSAWVTVINYVFPDRSVDRTALATFMEWQKGDEELHWKSRKDRANRWHAQGVAVTQENQGRGIGKKLMAEVIQWAEAEGVFVGLEASGPGEKLYLRVGFELLARFQNNVPGEDGGGVMLYTPTTYKGKKDD